MIYEALVKTFIIYGNRQIDAEEFARNWMEQIKLKNKLYIASAHKILKQTEQLTDAVNGEFFALMYGESNETY